MTETRETMAAARIMQAWEQGEVLAGLGEYTPTTRADGYAIQEQLERLAGHRLVGWKIAATSAAGQSYIGVDGPLAGRIFEKQVYSAGATVSIKYNHMRVCEPEFAFKFADDIIESDAPLSVDEVMSKVSTLHLALELPDSRFEDFATVGGPPLIADNACAKDLVLGPPVTADWRALDLAAHEVTGHVAGRIERHGVGANVLGDPRVALTWLVNELIAHNYSIYAGQFVTTGTAMVPLEIVEGDDVMADFGVLGQVQVNIGP